MKKLALVYSVLVIHAVAALGMSAAVLAAARGATTPGLCVPMAEGATRTMRRQPRPDVAQAQLEAETLALLQLERNGRRLPVLRVDSIAARVARAHAKDMCTRQYFAHKNPDGMQPWDRLRAARATFVAAAENIAKGQRTAVAVHASWMSSPGHHDNRMNPSYTRVGIGFHACDGANLWTEVFMR